MNISFVKQQPSSVLVVNLQLSGYFNSTDEFENHFVTSAVSEWRGFCVTVSVKIFPRVAVHLTTHERNDHDNTDSIRTDLSLTSCTLGSVHIGTFSIIVFGTLYFIMIGQFLPAWASFQPISLWSTCNAIFQAYEQFAFWRTAHLSVCDEKISNCRS